jgi:hypothetical protein
VKRGTLIAFVLLAWPLAALAQTRPSIQLSTDVEDGKKMIQATVTLNNKPLANVTLDYFVKRTFGNLAIGEDTTLDDGTSAVAFPSDLPGEMDGSLHFSVRVKSPDPYTGASTAAVLAADTPHALIADAFPRALWAPEAPLALMASIGAILGCVWLSYLFVVSQIYAIRKDSTS